MEQEIAELYNKLHSELYKWCQMLTGDSYLSQELVQEAFLRAIDHFESISSLSYEQQRSWLYTTIKHAYLDICRKNKRETLIDEVPEDVITRDIYSEKDLFDLINSLPSLEGKLFTMKYLNGFTSGQIGKMMGIPPGTVRSKLSDARKHLREQLGR